MKRIFFILPVVLLLSSFSSKPVDVPLKKAKIGFVRTSRPIPKKQVFTNINISAENPQEIGGFRVELKNEETLQTYTFDIPQISSQMPVLGQIPTGSYSVFFYNLAYVPVNYTFDYEIGDYGTYGFLGGSGASVQLYSVPIYNDNIIKVSKRII